MPRTIVVAMVPDYPPYSFVDGSGELKGAIRDLWDLWSAHSGVAVQYVPADWQAAHAMVLDGRVDVIGTMPQPRARYADDLEYSRQELEPLTYHLFHRPEVALPELGDDTNADGLKGFTIGVVANGSCDRWLAERGQQFIRSYPSFAQMTQGAERGEVNVLCSGRGRALIGLESRRLGTSFNTSPTLFTGGIHWATRHSDGALHAAIEQGFARVGAEEKEDIKARWLPRTPWNAADRPQGHLLAYYLLAAVAAALVVMAWNANLVCRIRRSRKKMKQTEQHFAALMRNLPDIAWLKDVDGRFLVVSDALARLCGVNRASDMIGKTDLDYFPPSMAEGFRRDDAEVLRSLTSKVVTERIIDAAGAETWIETIKSPIFDEHGACTGTVGVARDVTRRVVAEERLSKSEEEFRALAEHTPDTVARYDRDLRRTYANTAFAAAAGVPAEQLMGAIAGESGMGDCGQAYRAAIRAVFQTGEEGELELSWQGGDGRTITADVRLVPERDAEGNVVSVLSVGRDVGRLKETEAQLRQHALRLGTMIDNLPGVVYRKEYVANDNRIVFVSESHRELTGYDFENVRQLTFDERLNRLWHPDDAEALRAISEPIREGAGSAEGKARLLRPDGTVVFVAIREKVVLRAPDRIVVEGLLFDITSEELAKRDLEESEQRRRRAEERLNESRRFQALGQLAGGIAHDFNNLLGAILGFSHFIVEDSAPDSATHRFASKIVDVAQKGRGTVEQIMNYSRQKELVRTRFTLQDVITDALSVCQANSNGDVSFVADLSLGATCIEADRDQLTRVLVNLCLNGRDAMDGRQGTICVGAHEGVIDPEALVRLVERDMSGAAADIETWQDAAGYSWAVVGQLPRQQPHISLYVADNGSGMDPKLIQQIFTPFFTTKDRSRGTGLGLAVVHGIVLAHGGALMIRSKMGEGSRFDILLPPGGSRDVEGTVSQPKTGQSAKARVLLVDDNADLCEAMAEALRRMNYAVDPFSDPLSAMDSFNRTPDAWNLVISDHIMPGLRGVDLIRKVRGVRPQLPCLLCTGFAEELTEAACKEAGALAVLRKPVGLQEMVSAIKLALTS
ncbi:MAG TPA: PAS domain S-box protein [Magnetospirillum sp.]|nr:PAS domain S-box protein [Magnetospirillum sp.]